MEEDSPESAFVRFPLTSQRAGNLALIGQPDRWENTVVYVTAISMYTHGV